MGTWNHRIIRCPFEDDPTGPDWLHLIECYYDKDGKPIGYAFVSRVFCEPLGDTGIDGIRETLERQARAAQHPIMTQADFPADCGV